MILFNRLITLAVLGSVGGCESVAMESSDFNSQNSGVDVDKPKEKTNDREEEMTEESVHARLIQEIYNPKHSRL